jgi:hypothetical protein
MNWMMMKMRAMPWMKMIQLCFLSKTYLVKHVDLETGEVPGAFKESPLTVLGEAFMLLSNENT